MAMRFTVDEIEYELLFADGPAEDESLLECWTVVGDEFDEFLFSLFRKGDRTVLRRENGPDEIPLALIEKTIAALDDLGFYLDIPYPNE